MASKILFTKYAVCNVVELRKKPGQSSTETTQVYDRRGDNFGFSEIERVGI
jgi:hypothetical protein